MIECGPAFDDPAVLASIVTIVRPPESRRVRLGRWEEGKERTWTLPRSLLQSLPDQPLFSDLRPKEAALFRKIDQAPCRLGDLAAVTRGMECGKNDPHITNRPKPGFLPVITGQSVHEFRVEPQGLFMPPGLKPVSKYKRRELFETVPKLLLRLWPRTRFVRWTCEATSTATRSTPSCSRGRRWTPTRRWPVC